MPWRRTQAPAPGSPTSSASTLVRGSGPGVGDAAPGRGTPPRLPKTGIDVGEVSGAPTEDAVYAALRREAMVGRQTALALLDEAWRAAATGRAGVVTIAGPAGVGKSRLVAGSRTGLLPTGPQCWWAGATTRPLVPPSSRRSPPAHGCGP